MKNGPYELVIAPDGYPGKRYRDRYAYEHVVVYWKHHGAIPAAGFEIHHLNGNHRDNRIENLQLLTAQEHQRIHAEKDREAAAVRLMCSSCGSEFKRRRSRVKPTANYCSRKCQHKSMVRGTRVGSRERTVNASRKPPLVRVQPSQPNF